MQTSFFSFPQWNQVQTPLYNTNPDPLDDLVADGYLKVDQYEISPKMDLLSSFKNDDEMFFQRKMWAYNLNKFDLTSCLDNSINLELYSTDESKSICESIKYLDNIPSPNISHIYKTEIDFKSFQSLEIIKVEDTKKISKKNVLLVAKVQASKKIKSKSTKKIQKKGKNVKRISERLKNIVKNYGKNCASFAIGDLGFKYLAQKLTNDEITRFKAYIRVRIPTITNISKFREMLLANQNDEPEIIKFKQTFQKICEIFVEDYSINWIFHSPRISDVKGHIFARGKMLRRIQNPTYFTYIH